MGDVKGREAKLAASTNGSSYTDIEGILDVSYSGSTGEIDVTDMDSGEWTEHLVGRSEVSLSFNANWDEAATGLMMLYTAWTGNTQIYLRWRPRGDGATYKEFIGLGTITKFEESQAHDGKAELSIDWKLTGTPTIQDQT